MVKNKVAAPFKIAEFEVIYGKGISRAGELLDLGEAADLVKRSGSWYSYGGERLGQGRENARRFLEEHPEVAEQMYGKLRFELGLSEAEPAAETGEAAEPAEAAPDDDAPKGRAKAKAASA